VECFRHKLTRACEKEQDNLKQSQDKMKYWYDKDAMIRQFKPGEKVIVLLLIPCHPLQANYFKKNSNSANLFHLYALGAKLHQHLHHLYQLLTYIFSRSLMLSPDICVCSFFS
jgi:hypothetical protein